MLIKDFFLFFIIYFICTLTALVFQIIIVRFFNSRSFSMQMLGWPILSVLVSSFFCWALISKQFSNMESYYLANLGAGMAAIFSFSLYTFFGPITADRSTAAQMIVLLHDTPTELTRMELLNRFNVKNLLEKRYEECLRARIICDKNGGVVLTPKGRFIAKLYIFLIKILDLQNKPQYKELF